MALISAFLLVLGLAAAAGATTNFANAPSGSHYANGYSEPVCTFDATTATASCTTTQIGGVGHTNATVSLSVTGSFTGVCHNPGNYNVVTPFTRTKSASTSSNIASTKNGQLIVPPQSATGPTVSAFRATFKCPNPNWTPDVTHVTYTFLYTLTFAGFTAPAITISGP